MEKYHIRSDVMNKLEESLLQLRTRHPNIDGKELEEVQKKMNAVIDNYFKDYFSILVDDLITSIFNFIPVRTLLKAVWKVCRRFRSLCLESCKFRGIKWYTHLPEEEIYGGSDEMYTKARIYRMIKAYPLGDVVIPLLKRVYNCDWRWFALCLESPAEELYRRRRQMKEYAHHYFSKEFDAYSDIYIGRFRGTLLKLDPQDPDFSSLFHGPGMILQLIEVALKGGLFKWEIILIATSLRKGQNGVCVMENGAVVRGKFTDYNELAQPYSVTYYKGLDYVRAEFVNEIRKMKEKEESFVSLAEQTSTPPNIFMETYSSVYNNPNLIFGTVDSPCLDAQEAQSVLFRCDNCKIFYCIFCVRHCTCGLPYHCLRKDLDDDHWKEITCENNKKARI